MAEYYDGGGTRAGPFVSLANPWSRWLEPIGGFPKSSLDDLEVANRV